MGTPLLRCDNTTPHPTHIYVVLDDARYTRPRWVDVACPGVEAPVDDWIRTPRPRHDSAVFRPTPWLWACAAATLVATALLVAAVLGYIPWARP